MTVTKLENLVNPEVMSDMISASLPAQIKFSPLARIDTTLVGQAGDTVTVPRYEYIGDAEDLVEGIEMGMVTLTTSTQSVTIKQAGRGIDISDKSALSAYGDPIGQAPQQLKQAIASKIDNDFVEALDGATLEYDGSAEQISYEAVVNAIDVFEEEGIEAKVLFVNPKQMSALRLDTNFVNGVTNAYLADTVGTVAGCQVVPSKKVKLDVDTGTYTNFIVKPNALALYLKRDVKVESGRNIKAKTTEITADAYYAVAIEDESKVLKFTTKA